MSYPVEIDHVTLCVRDLDRMRAFYRDAIGLADFGTADGVARLGAGDRLLLKLVHEPGAAAAHSGQAGLFHTAFLLPQRAALGGWLRHAAEQGIRLTGASDHGVSEALYLDDPEKNGIEIYADRPAETWPRDGDRVQMVTEPLDVDDLLRGAMRWNGAPVGSCVGHVHLAAADLAEARSFLTGPLAATETFSVPGAAWFGWGGYHHQLAANVWNSGGAEPRRDGEAGLVAVALRLRDLKAPAIPAEAVSPDGIRFSVQD